MLMKSFAAASATAVFLTATPTLAATIVFDDFSGSLEAIDVPYTGASNTDFDAFGAGTRTVSVEATQNFGNPIADAKLEINEGLLAFSTDEGVTAKGTLTYTNVGDISNGANPFFQFVVKNFDNFAEFSVRAEDTMGGVSTYSETLTPTFNPVLYFSQFMGTADFNSLLTLSFMIDTTNVNPVGTPYFFAGGAVTNADGALDAILLNAPSEVPLPAAGFLLFGALGGVAALRRRKSTKAA